MRFSTLIAGAFVACASSAPLEKRRVFPASNFNALSISGGVAGNALAEAEARFTRLNPNNLASADQGDIAFIQSVNSICNQAETQAYVPAIAAASGEEAAGLKRGMVKNKVLKIKAEILRLQIDQAQGSRPNTAAGLRRRLRFDANTL